MHVLIADDARDVAEVVAFGVRMIWPQSTVALAASGEAALRAFNEQPCDLAILDVSMPAPDGFAVCWQLRQQSTIPILMLTVHDAPQDKVRALDLGADDYVTKPFDETELLARLRALVRRAQIDATAATMLTIGGMRLDMTTRQVSSDGTPVSLTSTEYRLLEELMRHAGTVLTHRELLERVWGPEYVHDVHYLKIFVRRLRQKLGDTADAPRYLQTEWGIGYRFAAPPSLHHAPRPDHRSANDAETDA